MKMKEKLVWTATAVLVVGAVFSASWLVVGNGLEILRVFGPRYEQARREIFEQSKAYNQGMVQELQDMRFQYIKADREHQAALAGIIRHRAADFDLRDPRVPEDLREFIVSLRR